MTPTETEVSVGFFMLNYFWVGLGGALGSVARFWASGFVARHFGEAFPFGTLVVNVTGSFLIGFFATLTDVDGRWLVAPSFRTFFMAGICGGYTTFSSFSLQTLNLVRDGEWLHAGANAVSSVVLCLVAVWLGHLLALYLNSTKGS
jgi:CrcB protein